MSQRPAFEVADVFRRYRDSFLATHGDSASLAQRRILDLLPACRTAALGGHLDQCDTCSQTVVSFNSCRDRHCPKCLATATAEWLEARQKELLSTAYFHVVFTLPGSLRPIALQNPTVVYDLLFRAASETLLQIAGDPRHLGAQIGVLAILHTWSQNLQHHPHVHCVIPGGGISPDKTRWISCRDGFFLPVRVLSRLFRGKLLAFLQTAFDAGAMTFHGSLEPLRDAKVFRALLSTVRRKEWVVYAKPPFGGPDQVLKYLARYTHRVAISNHRLISIDDDKVTFRWKDYADGSRPRKMTLSATEFVRRFLLHVLPRRFVRIRYYGFFANRHRKANLALCHSLLGEPKPVVTPTPMETDGLLPPDSDTKPSRDHRPSCPFCRNGHLVILRQLRPDEVPLFDVHKAPRDTT